MPTYARDALEMTAVWLLLVTRYQRWSREHKARGQGQGHKKNRGQGQGQPFREQTLSRSRTEMLEAKAKNQGHSRKCYSKKKGLQKSFLDDLQFIGVPRIFDWRRPKSQLTCNKVIKIFPNRKFLRDKDMKRWKI